MERKLARKHVAFHGRGTTLRTQQTVAVRREQSRGGRFRKPAQKKCASLRRRFASCGAGCLAINQSIHERSDGNLVFSSRSLQQAVPCITRRCNASLGYGTIDNSTRKLYLERQNRTEIKLRGNAGIGEVGSVHAPRVPGSPRIVHTALNKSSSEAAVRGTRTAGPSRRLGGAVYTHESYHTRLISQRRNDSGKVRR